MYFVVIILSHLKPFLVGLITILVKIRKIFIDVIIEFYLFLLFVKFIKSIVEIILDQVQLTVKGYSNRTLPLFVEP